MVLAQKQGCIPVKWTRAHNNLPHNYNLLIWTKEPKIKCWNKKTDHTKMILSKLNSYTHKYIYNSPLTEIPIQSERPYLNRNVLPVRSGICGLSLERSSLVNGLAFKENLLSLSRSYQWPIVPPLGVDFMGIPLLSPNSDFVWLEFPWSLCMLWVHMCNCPAVSRKVSLLSCLWLFQSFCPLLCNDH